jgi:hypothetical protein
MTARVLFVRRVAAVTSLLAAIARPALAQAWVLPGRTGAVTLAVQEIDHVGRMLDDGTRAPVGKAVNAGVDVELDYAFTDRWSISTSLPYIVSKFTDKGAPPPPLTLTAVDACRCWNSAFADFGFTARYNAVNINRVFMLTPFAAVTLPSHAYAYAGEAVVGRRLKELQVGANAGQRLDRVLNGLSVQAGYRYTFVGKDLGIPNNRSNGSTQASFAFPRGYSVRGIVNWQRTHGGLRFPSEVDVPGAPERLTEFHRMLRDNYLHVGGGLSYSRGAWDLSGTVLLTARGSNSHDVRVYSFTIGRLFEIHRG